MYGLRHLLQISLDFWPKSQKKPQNDCLIIYNHKIIRQLQETTAMRQNDIRKLY